MGVDLGSLVPAEPVTLRELDGKVLFFDGNNALYQFLAIIRQPDGTPLKDRQGRVTSHLAGLIYRTANLVEAGILPVFVWDGRPDERKAATLEERRERREQAAQEAAEAREAGDLQRARTKAMQSSRLSSTMIEQADTLLGHLGVPTLRAPGEGEAQAARAIQEDHGFASVSQDFDSLLFGTPRLIRNLGVRQRRKVPGKDAYVEVTPEILRLDQVLETLELSREQLVGVGVLMGTDYNDGIHGVGPKTALEGIREHGTLEAAAEALGGDVEEMTTVAEIFLDPVTDEVGRLTWGPVDEAAAIGYLVDEFGFSEDRVAKAADRYGRLERATRQGSLTDFF